MFIVGSVIAVMVGAVVWAMLAVAGQDDDRMGRPRG